MSHDDGPSKVTEIARRMDKSTQYVNVYRARLIAAGIIGAANYGSVDFALPYLREYIREHAAQLGTGYRT
jgi:Mn-dependent DtxR family transcriptional regulator